MADLAPIDICGNLSTDFKGSGIGPLILALSILEGMMVCIVLCLNLTNLKSHLAILFCACSLYACCFPDQWTSLSFPLFIFCISEHFWPLYLAWPCKQALIPMLSPFIFLSADHFFLKHCLMYSISCNFKSLTTEMLGVPPIKWQSSGYFNHPTYHFHWYGPCLSEPSSLSPNGLFRQIK